MKKWKVLGSVLVVFLLGVLTGALLMYQNCQQKLENIVSDEPRTMREFIVQRLTRELHLDSAQMDQLRAIVKETRAEMKNARKQTRPQIEEILARSQDRVRALLRPNQLAQYDKIVAEHKKKRENVEHEE